MSTKKKQPKTKPAGKARKTPKAPPVVTAPKAERAPRTRERDTRLPPAGTTIVRPYKGRDIRVQVLDDGFRWEGNEYRSLSALAAKVTGAASINGYLFFHLTGASAAATSKPSKRKEKTAPEASPAEVTAPALATATA
jgi:hypothetical protein